MAKKARTEYASYEAVKERSRRVGAEKSAEGRNLPPIRAVANPVRRAQAAMSLRDFCESYFPHRFVLAWSDDHLRVICRLEDAIFRGGLFALAMPRGSGKSTLAEVACLWAAFCGHRAFVLLIGSTSGHAIQSLDAIKSEIETNEVLAEDWPEVCDPIVALEGIANRCKGQLYDFERTRISWRKDEVVLPTIPGSKASGAILRVAGITGRIRGQKYSRPDGRTVRPSLVIVDDPQTDASARSLSQCEQRERIMSGAILGLAGPGEKIAGVCPCTVVRTGDLADRLLDRELHPEWQGQRMKMVYEFPKATALWDEYAELRDESLRNDGDGSQATEFYRARREAMDAGAVVAWPERHLAEELSGIQGAMNLFYDDRQAFFAEYQNQPLPPESEANQLKAELIAARTNNLERRIVPLAANRITAFVDVQKKLLYYVVAAWADDFTGAVIDYGSYPDQARKYFTLADSQHTMADAAKGSGLEGSIHAGLTALADHLLSREWSREAGSVLKIDKLLVDSKWQTDTVFAWCRSTPHAATVMPSQGKYVGAGSVPWSDYVKKEGEKLGHHWLIPAGAPRAIRSLRIDTNFWKSFVATRLTTAIGDKGALTLFGKAGHDHRLFADHCCAEERSTQAEKGRTVDIWRWRPGRPDNHFWDALTGCAAAASLVGAQLPGTTSARPAATAKPANAKDDYEKRRREFEAKRGY